MKSMAFSKAGCLCIMQLRCLNMSPQDMYPYLRLYGNSVSRMWTSVIKKKCRLKNTILINIYQFLSSGRGKHIVSSYLTLAGIYKFILQAASFFFLSSSCFFFHADTHHGRVLLYINCSFTTLAPLMFGVDHFLLWSCPRPCRLSRSIPGLYQLGARETVPLTPRHLQTSSNAEEGTRSSLTGNHCSRCGNIFKSFWC